ncbi:MAG: GtrA family protein [Rhodoferax sp.]|uniref:GtrA family protein n=1 Tax=Rhodoferax sp. TaxID=50421 RepID=UPI00261C955F|nr:GtrA family protein [Rhodoferax sp.]MDD5333801.1 GtrA family protein [Rhodoferax sp.]
MNSARSITLTTDSLLAQFGRYFLVGGGAFINDFALLYVLTEFGHLHYLLSASLAFLAGTAVNYSLSVSWVFEHRSVDNRMHEFALFALIGILGLVFNAALIWVFTELAQLHYLGSKMIAATLILLFNFGARKALLFSAGPGAKRSALKQSNA